MLLLLELFKLSALTLPAFAQFDGGWRHGRGHGGRYGYGMEMTLTYYLVRKGVDCPCDTSMGVYGDKTGPGSRYGY